MDRMFIKQGTLLVRKMANGSRRRSLLSIKPLAGGKRRVYLFHDILIIAKKKTDIKKTFATLSKKTRRGSVTDLPSPAEITSGGGGEDEGKKYELEDIIYLNNDCEVRETVGGASLYQVKEKEKEREKEREKDNEKFSFQVVVPSTGDVYTFFTSTKEAKNQWVTELNRQILHSPSQAK